MDITNWCIIVTSLLLVSANAGRYDQGPQRFYEPSSPAPQNLPNYETKDIVLYLTPRQVQALEAGGAILRPQESGPEEEYTVETEQEDQEEEEESEQSSDKVGDENFDDQKPKEVSELEEIFRILNKQIEEEAKRIHGDNNRGQVLPIDEQEQGEEYEDEEQEEEKQGGEQDENQQEENTELQNQRKIPSRFGVLQRYRVDKYFAPAISKKQNQQQKDNNLRPLFHHQKSSRFEEQINKKSEIESDSIKENNKALQDKYKVIPVEEESQEEIKQKLEVDLGQEQLVELLSPILANNKIVQAIAQHKGKLVQNELQLYKGLQELKAAPKHHNRKYATEIERLRANLEAQNALATAEALARATRLSPKEDFNKNNLQLDNSNILKNLALRDQQQFASADISTPIPVPVIKRSRTEVKTPVPIKAGRRAPASTRSKLHVKIDNPYEEQVAPARKDKRIPVSKPEELIIRHLWEH